MLLSPRFEVDVDVVQPFRAVGFSLIFSAWCLQWPYSDVRKNSLTFYIWPDDAKVPVHAGPGDASAFRPLRRQVQAREIASLGSARHLPWRTTHNLRLIGWYLKCMAGTFDYSLYINHSCKRNCYVRRCLCRRVKNIKVQLIASVSQHRHHAFKMLSKHAYKSLNFSLHCQIFNQPP